MCANIGEITRHPPLTEQGLFVSILASKSNSKRFEGLQLERGGKGTGQAVFPKPNYKSEHLPPDYHRSVGKVRCDAHTLKLLQVFGIQQQQRTSYHLGVVPLEWKERPHRSLSKAVKPGNGMDSTGIATVVRNGDAQLRRSRELGISEVRVCSGFLCLPIKNCLTFNG